MRGDTVIELSPTELCYLGLFLEGVGFNKLGRRMIKSDLSNFRKKSVSFRMPKWQAYWIARYIFDLAISHELFINDELWFRDWNLFCAALKLIGTVSAKRGKRENLKKLRSSFSSSESYDRRTLQRAKKRLKERMAASPAATDLGLFNELAQELVIALPD
jgi:hypothetical protein